MMDKYMYMRIECTSSRSIDLKPTHTGRRNKKKSTVHFAYHTPKLFFWRMMRAKIQAICLIIKYCAMDSFQVVSCVFGVGIVVVASLFSLGCFHYSGIVCMRGSCMSWARERERELRAYGNIWIAYHPGQYMPCYCCFGCMDRSKSHVHIRRNIEQSTISCTCMVDQYAAQERWHYSRIMDVDILFLFFTSFIFIVVVSCSFRPVILSIFILSF